MSISDREYASNVGRSAGNAVAEMVNCVISMEYRTPQERKQRMEECERVFKHEVRELDRIAAQCKSEPLNAKVSGPSDGSAPVPG